MNAPKLGDKAAWAPRIAQGADTLHTHALQGFQVLADDASGFGQLAAHVLQVGRASCAPRTALPGLVLVVEPCTLPVAMHAAPAPAPA